MDNIKNDAYFEQRLKTDLQFIVKHMRDIDVEELGGNVELNIVYETLKNDILELLELLSDEKCEIRGFDKSATPFLIFGDSGKGKNLDRK